MTRTTQILVDGLWQTVEFDELRTGDIFRLFDAGGELVEGVSVAETDAFARRGLLGVRCHLAGRRTPPPWQVATLFLDDNSVALVLTRDPENDDGHMRPAIFYDLTMVEEDNAFFDYPVGHGDIGLDDYQDGEKRWEFADMKYAPARVWKQLMVMTEWYEYEARLPRPPAEVTRILEEGAE